MEIIHISASKLKVMLTREDLEEFGLDAETLDYADGETRELFGALLSHVKDAADFQTDGYRLLVRMFPSRDGGCELFLTRIADLPLEESLHAAERPEPALDAFGFETLEELISVCRRLHGLGFCKKSSAYRSDEHRFYLLLEQARASKKEKSERISPLAFLCEYGKAEAVDSVLELLFEHGTLICEDNAVERLGVL